MAIAHDGEEILVLVKDNECLLVERVAQFRQFAPVACDRGVHTFIMSACICSYAVYSQWCWSPCSCAGVVCYAHNGGVWKSLIFLWR